MVGRVVRLADAAEDRAAHLPREQAHPEAVVARRWAGRQARRLKCSRNRRHQGVPRAARPWTHQASPDDDRAGGLGVKVTVRVAAGATAPVGRVPPKRRESSLDEPPHGAAREGIGFEASDWSRSPLFEQR